MCGIAGFVRRLGNATQPDDAVGPMLTALAHRGPDASGDWSGNSLDSRWRVTFGHRRLSLVDLSAGAQPMGNEDGQVQITFNGEIYGHQQLRRALESQGHVFRTRCDTEVIVHHHEQHGVAGLPALNGMFAFAIWDQSAGTLTLARDRAGIKPLYWSRLPDGGLAFASELLALCALPEVPRELDRAAIAEFFFRDYILPPRTALRDVSKLEPGCWLKWHVDGTIEQGRFWSPPRPEPENDVDFDELDRLLNDAVASQLEADVPVGVFLSGGIDSSLVACLARRHMDHETGGKLLTFSIGFDDPSFDESAHAQVVARHIGSEHHERRINERDLLSTVDAALACLDEPMGDHSIVPTYLVSQVARQHVKAVLGGDGGDELFAGYPTYLAHRVAGVYRALAPRVVRRSVIEPMVAALPVSPGYQRLDWKLKRFFLRWDDDPIMRHQRWMSATDLPDTRRLVGDVALLKNEIGSGALEDILSLDFRTYMSASVLTKVDRASMAHGLEVRPPLLDNAVVDHAMRLPARYKLRGRTTKWALKEVARRHVPASVIDRKKHGFSVPLATWLRGPLRQRVEAIATDGASGMVNGEVAATMVNEHMTMVRDHAKTLWGMLVLDHWARRLRAV